jgi:SAM-dependent methyltransferase
MTDAPQTPLQRFLTHAETALTSGHWQRAQLSAPHGAAGDLQRVLLRPVTLRGEPKVQVVHRHATRDLTDNLSPAQAVQLMTEMLGGTMAAAALWTQEAHWQIDINRKGRAKLSTHAVAVAAPTTAAAHNQEKTRWLDIQSPTWRALGLTQTGPGGAATLVPAMARKWRQINHFTEIFDAALRQAQLPAEAPVRVADFGCGRGYLTFAVHAHLVALGRLPQVLGVELRDALVVETEALARGQGLAGLHFAQGDVGQRTVQPLDVMIALHACDTATDHALHHGLRAGAAVILAAPCCHKQLRGQLQPPGVLKPLFKHGVHLGQEAEMLTDGLRALLLESQGYDTQVFEFVSLEHTQKNKMILAVRRSQRLPAREAQALEQVRALKDFWGVHAQQLECLMVQA